MNQLLKSAIIIMLLVGTTICLTSCKKKPTPPVLTTNNVSDISQTSATTGGNVLSDGGEEIIITGICWSTSANPSVEDKHTNDSRSLGSFITKLTDLTPDTRYYIKAYASNKEGIGYGNEVSFETSPVALVTLTTADVTMITPNSAVSGGNITADGGGAITDRGVCWGTATAPTTGGTNISSGAGTGTFTSSLTGLFPDATYYVRAYAINIAGTSYGNELVFTTPPSPTVVTNVSDGGIGSLRYALDYANSTIGIKETIEFNIPGTGPFIIRPSTQLPIITDPVVIDGYTQSGAMPATDSEFATILIEIHIAVTERMTGLIINAGNSTISGLSIIGFERNLILEETGNNTIKGNFISGGNGGNIFVYCSDNEIGGRSPAESNVIKFSEAGSGIKIDNTAGNAARNRITGNYIGVDPAVETGRGNDFYGISISDSPDNIIGGPSEQERNVISRNNAGISIGGVNATGNRIEGNYITDNDFNGIGVSSSGNFVGGTYPGAGNLISGNQWGLSLGSGANGNFIQGNLIGPDFTGTKAVGNGLGGILIGGGKNNQIGGLVPEAKNIISGNGEFGITFYVKPNSGGSITIAEGNKILGNYIGTDISGTKALGNGSAGIDLGDYANNNLIGGTEPGSGNIIAYNKRAGVSIQSAGNNSTGNSILSNSIHSNDGLGIDLGDTGVTLNDSVPDATGGYIYDSDIGPNYLQDNPVLKFITFGGGEIKITGSLRSAINTEYIIQFFASKSGDESGFGEGQEYLGSVVITTNSSGIAEFSKNFTRSMSGEKITATATDANGNTSEFSKYIEAR